MFVYYEIDLFF